jgi:hypothetical protein
MTAVVEVLKKHLSQGFKKGSLVVVAYNEARISDASPQFPMWLTEHASMGKVMGISSGKVEIKFSNGIVVKINTIDLQLYNTYTYLIKSKTTFILKKNFGSFGQPGETFYLEGNYFKRALEPVVYLEFDKYESCFTYCNQS